MRKIWNFVRRHLQEDFKLRLYSGIALFLGFFIALNYSINLENGIIDRNAGNPVRILFYFALYATAYYGGCFITFASTGKLPTFKSSQFLVWSSFGLLILALNVGFPYNMQLVGWFTDNPRLFSWGYKVMSNSRNFFVSALPLFLFALTTGQRRECLGVNAIHIDLSPYFQLLLILLPIIAMASFEPGFRNYYPTYKANAVAEAMGWPGFMPPLIYEIAYGLDFFNVEFMFRGFMVVGMSRILGKEAILPMVCVYCCLHFGKPIGECISSIFGGYVLGVIAFYTRNIWGGVIVHIGVAWMMELAAFLQKATH
jgi:hypothetical protein